MRSPARTGFTLIELLIVVGILLILAGISAANFQEFSTRAKVARVLAEHRTYATAIEAYYVDYNAFPRMAHWRFYRDPAFDNVYGTSVNGVFSNAISTPIAYVTGAWAVDPFAGTDASIPLDEKLYTYHVLDVYAARNPASTFWPAARNYYGSWRIGSIGPDRIFDHNFANSAQLPYDPTNGTLSFGNVWTSHYRPLNPPAIPILLGEH